MLSIKKNRVLNLIIVIAVIVGVTSCGTSKTKTNLILNDSFYDVDIQNGILYGTYKGGIKSLNLTTNKENQINVAIDKYAKIEVLDKKIYIFRSDSITIYDTKLIKIKAVSFGVPAIIDKIQKHTDGIYFFSNDMESRNRSFNFMDKDDNTIKNLNISNAQNYYMDDKTLTVFTSDGQIMKKSKYNISDKSFVSDKTVYKIPGDNFTFDEKGTYLYIFDYKNLYKYNDSKDDDDLVYSLDNNDYEKAVLDGSNIYLIGLYNKTMVELNAKNLKPNFKQIKIYAPISDMSNLDPNFTLAVNKLIAKHPGVKVSIIQDDPAKYYDDLNIKLSSKDSTYDIVYLDGYNAINYVNKGALYNLSNNKTFMKNFNNNVNPGLKSLTSKGDYNFGIPQGINIKPIKINLTRLKALGIDYNFGSTFTYDDYFSILDKIKSVDEKYFVQNSIFTTDYLNNYIASNIDVSTQKDTMTKSGLLDVLSKIQEYNDANTELQKNNNLSYDKTELPVFSYYGEGYLNTDDKFILMNTPIASGGKNYIDENYLGINRASKNLNLCTELFSDYYGSDIILTAESYDTMPIFKNIEEYGGILKEKYANQDVTDEELKLPTGEFAKTYNNMLYNADVNQVEWSSDLLDKMSKFSSKEISDGDLAQSILDYYNLKLKE